MKTNLKFIEALTGLPKHQIIKSLKKLATNNAIDWCIEKDGISLIVLMTPEDFLNGILHIEDTANQHSLTQQDEYLLLWLFRIKEYITNLTIVSDTVGQFTGLKDKNGVDIYEGDILQMWLEDSVEPQGGYFHLMYVVFTTEKGFVLWGDNMIIEDAEPLFEMLQWKDCTVIGNIHDNPELLNPK